MCFFVTITNDIIIMEVDFIFSLNLPREPVISQPWIKWILQIARARSVEILSQHDVDAKCIDFYINWARGASLQTDT
jgi:hypothetical protein